MQNEAASTNEAQAPEVNTNPAQAPLPDGRYSVQQVSYDDSSGEYSLFLLNTPPSVPSNFRTTNVKMARLTDAEISSGQSNYLNVAGGEVSLHVAENFQIQYIHTTGSGV